MSEDDVSGDETKPPLILSHEDDVTYGEHTSYLGGDKTCVKACGVMSPSISVSELSDDDTTDDDDDVDDDVDDDDDDDVVDMSEPSSFLKNRIIVRV